MAMIYVKTKPGRRAYYQGKVIPTDKFIPVTDTPYIRRLANHWEDVEIKDEKAPQKQTPLKFPPSPTTMS